MPQPDEQAMEKLTALYEKRITQLSQRLTSGEIELGDWQITMREELRRAHALQLIAGSGGDKAGVDPNDWLKLGNELRSQYLYLEDFGRAIASGDLDSGSIEARARMYARSSRVSFWKQAGGDLELPAYPCDGSSECLSNCGCSWDIQEDEDGANAYWRLGKTDNCPTCLQRASEWSPYRVGEAA